MRDDEAKKYIFYGGTPLGKESHFYRQWLDEAKNAKEWEKVKKWVDASTPSDTDPAFARFLQRVLTPII